MESPAISTGLFACLISQAIGTSAAATADRSTLVCVLVVIRDLEFDNQPNHLLVASSEEMRHIAFF